jgi:D-lactate dehydrogenase
MKEGIIIVNTSRGELINNKDLLKALKSKKIGGAGLDVIEGENYIGHEEELLNKKINKKNMEKILLNKQIINHPNVIFTPHNAFNSKEAIQRIREETMNNYTSYMKKQPRNTIQ